MPESTNTAVGYLADIENTFRRYKGMAERAMAQVSPNRINWYFHNDSNSLAILVKHISGNLVSRFTDFLRTDGEKVGPPAWSSRTTSKIKPCSRA